MSTPVNPPSQRFPFEISGKVDAEVEKAIRFTFNGLTNHEQAFAALQAQGATGTTSTSGTTTTSAAAATTTTENITIVQSANSIGKVNNQTGVTAYQTLPSDYGAFIILNDAAAIAITLGTLGTGIVLPWFTNMINEGAGTATLTPFSGLINGNPTFTLPSGAGVTIAFDGTNFFTEVISNATGPVNTPAVTHQWLNAYTAATGVFGQTQPSFADVSGSVTTAQGPGAAFSGTVALAKITGGGADGSLTLVNGFVTAYTPPT